MLFHELRRIQDITERASNLKKGRNSLTFRLLLGKLTEMKNVHPWRAVFLESSIPLNIIIHRAPTFYL